MNKNVCIGCILILLIGIFLSGCSDKSDKVKFDEGISLFVYPQENPSAIYVDEEGLLYMAQTSQREKQENTEASNVNGDLSLFETTVLSVNEEGKVLENFNINTQGTYINNMVIHNRMLYYVLNKTITEDGSFKQCAIFNSYNMDNGENEELYVFEDYSEIDDLEIIDDTVYFIGINKNKIDKSYELHKDTPTYLYKGEVVFEFSIADSNMVEIPIEFPICMAKSLNHTLIINAYDSNGGYYFAEYDPKNDTLSDKVYLNYKIHSGILKGDFCIVNNENNIIYYDYEREVLVEASTKSNEGMVEVMPGVRIIGRYLTCFGDYTYYFDTDTRKIVRIKNSVYIRGNKTINMISYATDLEAPFGYGYSITREVYDKDEAFALKVLAQDKDFDLYLLNSWHPFSDNIHKNGAFYPLNKVEGVQEYLDACFPYIKEAATDINGNIWMLPINVDIDCLYYIEENCIGQGIEITRDISLEKLLELQLTAVNNNQLQGNYDVLGGYSLVNNITLQFLRSGLSLDSDEFRDLAKLTKNYYNRIQVDSIIDTRNDLFGWYNQSLINNFIAMNPQSLKRFNPLIDTYQILGIPSFDNSDSYIATGLFLCVNPETKNLKETLDYIETYVKYSLSEGKPLLFKDKTLYQDTAFQQGVYEVYSKGDICFTLPKNVFFDDFLRYINSEIELEEMITEASRKMEIYRKE